MVSIDAFTNRRYHNFFISILLVLLLGLSLLGILQIVNLTVTVSRDDAKRTLSAPSQWPEVTVTKGSVKVLETDRKCNFFNCFNVYRCGRSGHQKLSVYIYPLVRYVDEEGVEIKSHSREFLQILDAVVNSEYYVSDPLEACLFIPPIDTLNENNLRKDKIAESLASLEHWSGGENHLIFNLLPGDSPRVFPDFWRVERGKALVAGGGFSALIPIGRASMCLFPIYNPLHQDVPPSERPMSERPWFLISSQGNIHRDIAKIWSCKSLPLPPPLTPSSSSIAVNPQT
ncbi:UNVERIFIED_CONTAM: hypothetical protein GTU68_040981 [Idotea baltica]|nr:hypothetical protein [Idotea baltica]